MSRPGRPLPARSRWSGLLLCGALVALGPHRLPAQAGNLPAQDEGKRLFETICVACHTIGAGVRIGPDLAGVTERRDADWLRRFIRDPEQMRKAGDSIATANRAQYGIPMPDFGLTAPQVESVIAHLGAAAASPAVRPALYLPTIGLAALAAAGITLIALTLGTRRVETRA